MFLEGVQTRKRKHAFMPFDKMTSDKMSPITEDW